MATMLVNLDVDDLERATRFYSQAFGLSIGRRFGPHATELLGFATPLYLLVKKSGTPPFPGAANTRAYERHWTPVHLDFVVEDVDQALARALEVGAIQEGPIKDHNWGRIVMLADPFGHGFCLLQFVGRGYDEVASME
jgi:predicted enzyme related to lactoylglutathione lyase